MKISKKIVSVLVIAAMLFSMSACGKSEKKDVSKDAEGTKTSTEVKTETETEVINEPVTIKFFSNLPDRASGQGQLEQTLIDNYMEENPYVTVEVEGLQDEPYKQKFKAYAAGNQLPDVYTVWGQPSFFNPVMAEGYAAGLNVSDYDTYGFLPGSLDGFSLDGKLYGLPRGTDVGVIYYNKALFEDNNVKVPETIEELIEASNAFRAKGIAPLSMVGKDKWPLNLFFQELVIKNSGDQKLIYDAVDQDINFAENDILRKTAEDFKALVDAGIFQDSFIAADYGAAQNLFVQEEAAMFYMGSWEVGMATNDSFSESFRDNLEVTSFPIISGGKGELTDLLAWNGGGYAISSDSEVQEEAIKLLNYIMNPENWAKNAWQLGLIIPAQNYDEYLTGDETGIQKSLTNIISSSTSISGTPWNDAGDAGFKTSIENILQELAAGAIDVDKFLQECDAVSQKISFE